MGVIVNVDDFGLSKGVNEAVFELVSKRAVSSTTVMVTMPHAHEASLLPCGDAFSVGLHFNLTEGSPISPCALVPTLVDAHGKFHNHKVLRQRLSSGKVKSSEVVRELAAQYETLVSILGREGSHIDSHENIHKHWFIAHCFTLFASNERKLGVRCPSRYIGCKTDKGMAFRSSFRNALVSGDLKRASTDLYLHLLGVWLRRCYSSPRGEIHHRTNRKLELLNDIACSREFFVPDGAVFELACHPSVDLSGITESQLGERRLLEFKTMRQADFSDRINEIGLTSYHSLLN